MHSHFRMPSFDGLSHGCLNPCFNGRCTRTLSNNIPHGKSRGVLILVLMEDALAPNSQEVKEQVVDVLILVLMEDALALSYDY